MNIISGLAAITANASFNLAAWIMRSKRKTAPSDVSEMAAPNRAFQIVLRLAKMQHLANTPQIRELLMLFRDTWRIRPGQVHVSHDCVREAATTWMVRNTLKPAGLLHGPP